MLGVALCRYHIKSHLDIRHTGELTKHKVDNKTVGLTVWDTMCGIGRDDHHDEHHFAKLRRHGYVNTDVVLLCYSTVNLQSLNHVTRWHAYTNLTINIKSDHTRYMRIHSYWHPEVHRLLPDVPFILVGTKTDLSMYEQQLTPHCMAVTLHVLQHYCDAR